MNARINHIDGLLDDLIKGMGIISVISISKIKKITAII